MDETVNQNIMGGVYAILAIVLVVLTIGIVDNNTVKNSLPKPIYNHAGDNLNIAQRDKPILEVTSSIVPLNIEFNYYDHVVAKNDSGQDIRNKVTMYGIVDISHKGVYDVVFSLKDNGITLRKEATFIVD